MKTKDVLEPALLEAGMLGLAALLGYLAHQPLLFASLGPTAYEMIETPERPSARPRNVLLGHALGMVAALLALAITHAWSAPAISLQGVPGLRVCAAVLAGFGTVVATLLLQAAQPAALSTTLLVASGIMQSPRGLACITCSVLLFAALGALIRHFRPDPS